jgi:hypothetical protein
MTNSIVKTQKTSSLFVTQFVYFNRNKYLVGLFFPPCINGEGLYAEALVFTCTVCSLPNRGRLVGMRWGWHRIRTSRVRSRWKTRWSCLQIRGYALIQVPWLLFNRLSYKSYKDNVRCIDVAQYRSHLLWFVWYAKDVNPFMSSRVSKPLKPYPASSRASLG